MRRRLLVVLAPAAALIGIFLTLLLRSTGESATPQFDGERLTLVSAARRKELPDLAGTTLTPPPATLSLRVLDGRPTFIDVWASWCVPCREEAPMLARLWRRYRTQVRFLGIDVEDTRADARAFVRRYRLGYPNVFDRSAALAGKLGFFGLPTAYLVDRRGRIAATLIGKQEEAALRSGLTALVGEPKSGR